MAQYNFEGNLNGINERQLEFINKVIAEHGLKSSKATFEQVGKAGDNYAATLKRIKLEGENGTVNMILKVAPSSEAMRKPLNSFILFKNEHIMYTEFLPLILGLQKEADVPEEEQIRFAKCYGSLSEAPNEVLLLEDLNSSDFVMLDKFEPLPDECLKNILKSFGILHSLSYVLRNKDPEKYECFKNNLSNILKGKGDLEDSKFYFKQVESSALMLLDEPKYKNILKNKVGDVLDISLKLSDYEEKSKYSVIQQGDAWNNNFMFKFEEGKLKRSVLIDYQLSRNSNPVCDIVSVLFNCTEHETRSKHFLEWLDYYHNELDRSLNNFGLKASMIYPRHQLDADLKRYGKCLFGFGIFTARFLTLKSDDANDMQTAMETGDMSKMAETMNQFSSSKTENGSLFKKRIVDLIDTCLQFGLL